MSDAKAKHGTVKNRAGETSVSRAGMKMTIVEYFSAENMTVRFEDGAIKRRVSYRRFKEGSVRHPHYFADRVGSEGVNLEGRKMRVVSAGPPHGFIVRFDDGQEVKSTYDGFKKGRTLHPDDAAVREEGDRTRAVEWGKRLSAKMKDRYSYIAVERTGMRKKMRCGEIAEVVDYRGSRDITVRFDSGVEVAHRTWQAFNKGLISPYTAKERIRRSRRKMK